MREGGREVALFARMLDRATVVKERERERERQRGGRDFGAISLWILVDFGTISCGFWYQMDQALPTIWGAVGPVRTQA